MRALIAFTVCCFVVSGCAMHDRLAGEPCGTEGDCVEGTTCAAVRMTASSFDYECIALCGPETGFRCGGGELCWLAHGDDFDLYGCFPGGSDPLGAPCTYLPNCARGLQCEFEVPPDGSEPTSGMCVPGCELGPCALGQACRYVDDCDAGLECGPVVRDGALGGECRPACTLADDRPVGLCEDGSACVLLSDLVPGRGVCIPGGAVPLGGSCTMAAECERGLVCVDDGSGQGVCGRACDTPDDCEAPERCVVWLCE